MLQSRGSRALERRCKEVYAVLERRVSWLELVSHRERGRAQQRSRDERMSVRPCGGGKTTPESWHAPGRMLL